MSFDHKYQGDSGIVGDELIANLSKVEEIGVIVEKAVKDGYFSLPEALSAYQFSEIEYLAYLLLKNKGKLEAESKEKQIVDTVLYIVVTFQAPSASFAPAGKKIMQALKNIIDSSPSSDAEVNDLANAW